MTTNREAANRVNPNTISDLLRSLSLGNLLLGQLVQCRREVNPDAGGNEGYNLATVDAVKLPDHAKAATILRATVKAAGVAAGEFTPQAFGATPATLQCAVAPNGDIVFLATDAVTRVDLIYVPERGEVVETVLPVVANVLTLPTTGAFARGVVLLEEVEAIAGTAVGRKVVLVPGAGAPNAGQARLNLAKTTVTFAVADAVTRARVKVLVGTAADLQSVLTGAATLI